MNDVCVLTIDKMLSEEDRILIKGVRVDKEYNAKKIIADFSR